MGDNTMETGLMTATAKVFLAGHWVKNTKAASLKAQGMDKVFLSGQTDVATKANGKGTRYVDKVYSATPTEDATRESSWKVNGMGTAS